MTTTLTAPPTPDDPNPDALAEVARAAQAFRDSLTAAVVPFLARVSAGAAYAHLWECRDDAARAMLDRLDPDQLAYAIRVADLLAVYAEQIAARQIRDAAAGTGAGQ